MAKGQGILSRHGVFERNSWLLLVGSLLVVTIGGIVEIIPLFLIQNTVERVQGVRPYTPLELAGQRIYIREGCYNCHSQMIRSLRSEVERYGHYSLAAESMYDRPFQWGSKRTGPDLARVGGKFSDEWHQIHMGNPRAVVPESIMPGYPYLAKTVLDTTDIKGLIGNRQFIGDPYSDEQVENVLSDLKAQAVTYGDGSDGFAERWPGAAARDWDGNPDEVTELDALIAYLQVLGTLVDFNLYDTEANER